MWRMSGNETNKINVNNQINVANVVNGGYRSRVALLFRATSVPSAVRRTTTR